MRPPVFRGDQPRVGAGDLPPRTPARRDRVGRRPGSEQPRPAARRGRGASPWHAGGQHRHRGEPAQVLAPARSAWSRTACLEGTGRGRRCTEICARRRLPGSGQAVVRAERRRHGRSVQRCRARQVSQTRDDGVAPASGGHQQISRQRERARAGRRRLPRRARRFSSLGARRERRRPLRRRDARAAAATHLSRDRAADPADFVGDCRGPEDTRSVQYPVPGEGKRHQGHRMQPACFEELSLRLEGAAGEFHRDCHRRDDGPSGAGAQRIGDGRRVRRRQGAAVLLHPSRGRRSRAGRRDGVDRRSGLPG